MATARAKTSIRFEKEGKDAGGEEGSAFLHFHKVTIPKIIKPIKAQYARKFALTKRRLDVNTPVNEKLSMKDKTNRSSFEK